MPEDKINDAVPKDIGDPQPMPVFPSEFEIAMNILDQYQKQLDEHSAKTEAAIEKLKKNIRAAEDSSIAIMAQRKLIETLSRDLKKATGKE